MLLIIHDNCALLVRQYHREVFKICIFCSFAFTGVVGCWDHITVHRNDKFKFKIYTQSIRRNYLAFVLNAGIEYTIFWQISKKFTLRVIRSKYCHLFLICIKQNSNSYHTSIVTVVDGGTYQFAIVKLSIDNSNNHGSCGI